MQVKKVRKLIALLVSIGILGGATGCGLISKTPEAEKKTVVAKVNRTKITKGDIEKLVGFELSSYGYKCDKAFIENKDNQEMIKKVKETVLEKMVQQEVMLQKAKEMKITADAKKVDEKFNKTIEDSIKAAGDEEKFKTQLKDYNVTLDEYKVLIKKNIESGMILDQLYEKLTKDIVVTDEDAKKYYDAHPYEYTEKPNVLKGVAHILVSTQKEANDIKARLDKGEKFEDLAKKLSQDTGTKDAGGALGDIEYTDQNYDQGFLMGAIMAPEGKVSVPVQSQYGYHLIRVTKKEVYPSTPFDKVKDTIKKTTLEDTKYEKFSGFVKEWEGKAKIKKYADRL